MITLLLLLLIPSAFYFCDLLICIFINQRFPFILRLVIDIVAFTIFPFLFVQFMISDIQNLLTDVGTIVFYILCIICSISYFIASYANHTNKTAGNIINVLVVTGLLINFAIWIVLISQDFEFGILLGSIGNLPIILAITSTILYQYRQKKISEDIDEYLQNYSHE